jgi:hypothetical protein
MAGYNDAIDRFLNLRSADLQANATDAANVASQTSPDTFVVTDDGYNVIINRTYPFSFAYLYDNPDNPSQPIQGPRSANFLITLQTPDLTQPVTNLSVTPGLLMYGVKWDLIDKALPANKWLIDIQIYESLTGAFAGEEYLVWNGNGNSASILVSNTSNRWIRVDTRDQDYRKKSVVFGPFKASDPITVDTVGPANVTSVTTTSGIDTSGYLGFNAFASVSWPAVTGGGIRGYRIRFSNDNGATYSYVDSPGTGTTYKLAGLAIGSTYQIAVATYDEYNNTSSAYISASDVRVEGTPSVSNYITGGPFQFGVGVGSVSTNKGLYFDDSNYWYVNATNSARLKVGGATSNYLLWDGSTFAIDGNVTARGGTFSGNIFMSTTGASIYNGTIDASTGNLTGNGFALNSTGLKVANGTNSVTLSAATGAITANAGSIAGWTLSDTTLSKNNIVLNSAGTIQVGSSAAASVYLSSSGNFVMWAGNNTPDANAKFRVGTDGRLYATGATFTGSSIDGYATSGQLGAVSTTATNASSVAATASTTATNAFNKAVAAETAATNAQNTATNAANAAALKMAASEINTVIALDTTVINGSRITTGTIDVGRLNISGGNTTNGFVVDGTGIRGYSGGVNTLNISSTGDALMRGSIYSTVGEIGGFVLGNADLTASTSKLPRIIFGNKILLGWISGTDYGLQAGNPRGDSGASFRIFTEDNVNRFTADSASRTYAGEVRNALRAAPIRSIGAVQTESSSRRFKENISPAPKRYYDRILNVDPMFYTYRMDNEEVLPELRGHHRFGMIAEDLEEAGLGYFVERDMQGRPTNLNDMMSFPLLLIPIIKELKQEVQSLKDSIIAMGGTI